MEHDNDYLDRLIEAVEDECGMGAGAWDTIDPRSIARAFLACIPKVDAEVSDEMHRANFDDPLGNYVARRVEAYHESREA
jgi:hypothetical protein